MTIDELARRSYLQDARHSTTLPDWQETPESWKQNRRAMARAVVLALADDIETGLGGDVDDADRIAASQRLRALIAEARQVPS